MKLRLQIRVALWSNIGYVIHTKSSLVAFCINQHTVRQSVAVLLAYPRPLLYCANVLEPDLLIFLTYPTCLFAGCFPDSCVCVCEPFKVFEYSNRTKRYQLLRRIIRFRREHLKRQGRCKTVPIRQPKEDAEEEVELGEDETEEPPEGGQVQLHPLTNDALHAQNPYNKPTQILANSLKAVC
jgi:hypothetical protein